MKVLITGGYGFIGSHIAEKFYNEGHQIFIIDNLATGSCENVRFNHEFYEIDVANRECAKIFEYNKFDIVVHLAAQINISHSIDNPYIDAQSNILGLVNILQLSSEHKVKRFIFSSSSAVYGEPINIPISEDTKCDPKSLYGLSKLFGEQYCMKWKDIFEFQTLCLRLGNVYGPRQGKSGEGGAISLFIDKTINNEELTVCGDGNQTRDFIYVLDAVDAIYKASQSDITGIYNLSTGIECSINNLVNIFKKLFEVKNILHIELESKNISNVRLCPDSTRIKEALNWSPKYSLEEGIQATYEWNCKDAKK